MKSKLRILNLRSVVDNAIKLDALAASLLLENEIMN
jgi:hypothetical protein